MTKCEMLAEILALARVITDRGGGKIRFTCKKRAENAEMITPLWKG
ncbi:MAG: hypothetical protein FWF81_03760 [Defluviitaleaceae bacterium]|nr:hypothetical protein [Defluviitaleaceae bacterium]